MEEAPSTLLRLASRGRGQRDWLCQQRTAPAGQPERGPTGRAAGEASLRAASITSDTGGRGKGPRQGAAGQQGGEGQVPSPTRVTSVPPPPQPPLVAVPVPRRPRERGPHDPGRQGRSEGSPFPSPSLPPTPLTAVRGLPHFAGGGGIGRPNPPALTRPLPHTPLPSQLCGRGRAPPTRALP